MVSYHVRDRLIHHQERDVTLNLVFAVPVGTACGRHLVTNCETCSQPYSALHSSMYSVLLHSRCSITRCVSMVALNHTPSLQDAGACGL